jgi:hypothetical protein
VPGRRSRLWNLGDFDFHAASERGRLASWASVEPLPSSTVLPLDGDLGRGQEASEELEAERAVQGGWSRMFGG